MMPGAGKYQIRERVDADNDGLDDDDLEALGEQLLDIYLNEHVRWRGIPAAVWDYKIGGFQVLRKWLSYREKRVLGRDMSIEETRAFTNIARRLTAVVLQGPELDRNYLRITEATLSL
ncbi:adenine specific DNA methyltransferase domain protein [Mycobacterium xenopi 3993]|nr:adenine specific DNA methyltransferase domain protein [Mycobacterium xenopi 3993]